MDNQQFRQWLRASQFSSSKKQTIEVKGYDDERIKPLSVKAPGPDRGSSSMSLVERKMDRGQPEKHVAEVVAGTEDGQKLPATNPEDSMIIRIPNSAHPISDFEAINEEIDNAINEEHSIPDSTGEKEEAREAQKLYVEKRKEEALLSGEHGKSEVNMSGLSGDMEGEFVMGWADPNGKNKERKQGRGRKATATGPNTSPLRKKGSWTRQTTRPMQESQVYLIQEDVGSKRKLEEADTLEEQGIEGEKG